MNCDKVKAWLPHYIDGSANREIAELIRLHLDTCPACALAMEEARELAELWREMERNDWGRGGLDIPDISASVMDEIGRYEAERGERSTVSTATRRLFASRTSWVHYGVAACLTFLLFQFGVFEGLGYQISELNGHMSSSVTSWLGNKAQAAVNK